MEFNFKEHLEEINQDVIAVKIYNAINIIKSCPRPNNLARIEIMLEDELMRRLGYWYDFNNNIVRVRKGE